MQQAGPAGARAPRNGWRLPILVVALAVVVVAAGAVALNLAHGGGASPSGSAGATSTTSVGPGGSPEGTAATPPGSGASPTPGTSSGPPPTIGGVGGVQMPMVPVTSFWLTETDLSSAELSAALAGNGPAGQKVVVTDEDADAIAAALGITLGASVQRAKNADKVRTLVSNGALGVLRVSDIDPSVRALSLDGKALFGEQRISDLAEWPLTATVVAAADEVWDTSTTWTMLAGGDMFMDRGVYRAVVEQNKGVDWPFDGGTARVTGHHCCGVYVTTYQIPDVEFTGNKGAVRALVQNADVALANLETPVPDNWIYHAHNYTFSSDPGLLPMFTNAGMDFVSIANNHIKNFGASGIADTRKNLAAAGLKFAGAGKNLAEAGEVAYLNANGTRIGIVGCSGVASSDNATRTRAGVLPCTVGAVVPRIQEAKQHADLVIVFAHWGSETFNDPQTTQPPLAKAWIDAGAGLILGAHTHVPGAIQEIDGKVVFYSLGNFIFDQSFWTKEMESALPEMTFQGNRLVQIRLHPYVSPGEQPNLLDPATDDGKAILDTIRETSAKVGLKW